ncbi:MAG: DnaJ domain-containing protein, partial [Byssovorax sp.]
DETLVAFLAARGDLDRDAAMRLGAKLPPFGRHAGAALIAHGYLGQDDLWPVLRAHAEWIIGRTLQETTGTFEVEEEPPGRLKAEPGVFGGATGAEVLVEAIRRAIPPEIALARLGGPMARIDEGSRRALLAECALRREEEESVRLAPGRTLAEILDGAPPELADVLYALVSLGVLDVLTPVVSPAAASVRGAVDPLDQEAIRLRVKARMALVEDGDYFALLGVARGATGYEVKRAYLELRRAFEPARVLTAQTADLVNEVRTIIEVLDEAYEILREPNRRERYRKAIEAGPP